MVVVGWLIGLIAAVEAGVLKLWLRWRCVTIDRLLKLSTTVALLSGMSPSNHACHHPINGSADFAHHRLAPGRLPLELREEDRKLRSRCDADRAPPMPELVASEPLPVTEPMLERETGAPDDP